MSSCPLPPAGRVTEILAEEGDTVGVGQVIARLAIGGDTSGSAPSHHADTSGSDGGGATAQTVPSAATADAGGGAGGAVPDGARVSPVAARVAAAEGVDLTAVSGSGPGGRIVKTDVLGAGDGAGGQGNGAGATLSESPAVAASGKRTLLKGGAAMLARYMDESRSIPTATSFRTLTVTTLEGRRRELKAAGKRGVLHPPDRLRDRAGGRRDGRDDPPLRPIDGKPYRVSDGQVNLGLAVDVEKKDTRGAQAARAR